MLTVYYDVNWQNNETFHNTIQKFTPGETGEWNDIVATTDPNEADYHVIFNSPTRSVPDATKLVFCMEPPCSPQCQNLDAYGKQTYPVESYCRPQFWWVGKTYDELRKLSPPNKRKQLSWITSDKGRIGGLFKKFRKYLMTKDYKVHEYKNIPLCPNRLNFLNNPMDGHILRMEFLEHMRKDGLTELELYGRGQFDDLSCYKGEIKDKWDGLSDYRYTLAIENYRGPNYFTEKITDAWLSWTMPIYWGSTNLSEFVPDNSYVYIDIEDERAPQRVQEILESDIREENLGAIAEARERILNRYQIWPTVQRHINDLRR